MSLDDTLEEHRIPGVSLRNGMRKRVRLVTSGMRKRVRLVTSAFANERCCALGPWIHEDGERWDNAPELLQLKLAHASFRTVALAIAISITQGRLAESAIMLEPDALFENAARMLAHAVSRFENRRVTGAPSTPVRGKRSA